MQFALLILVPLLFLCIKENDGRKWEEISTKKQHKGLSERHTKSFTWVERSPLKYIEIESRRLGFFEIQTKKMRLQGITKETEHEVDWNI
jgi:hypothetical protein